MSEDTPCPLCKAHLWEGARCHYEKCEITLSYDSGLRFGRKQALEDVTSLLKCDCHSEMDGMCSRCKLVDKLTSRIMRE